MRFHEVQELREWLLSGLGELDNFARHDPDFRGNGHYEREAIAKQLELVENGKYRVVFLGTFNVGKSTAINAFLGGGYLPMDVEECTSQLTFIERGEKQQLNVRLGTSATIKELRAFQKAVTDAGVRATLQDEGRLFHVDFDEETPDAMRLCLEPLVTVMADEEHPELSPLREKIAEINLRLPSSVLVEDIVFVDTPGVHSVSDTRQEITYGVIERSHLVISIVDSSFAGNIHDINFIKRIIKWRGRHVFFVLNKADKLESSEIDVRGTRGPARALFESFERHGLPEESEVFFLSGYRALRAQQLEKGQIELDLVLDDNKISLPTSVAEAIEESESPSQELSDYLMQQSRFPELKQRLLDYLIHEDRVATLLETGVRFVGQRASEYVSSMENELALAKDPAKFVELRNNRERLLAELDRIRTSADRVLNLYNAQSKGGLVDDVKYGGFEARFREGLTDALVQEQIVEPVLAWLREADNLKNARKQQFKPLTAEVEARVDDYVSELLSRLNQSIDAAETSVREAVSEHLGQVQGLRLQMTNETSLDMARVDTEMTGSYVAFSASGAAIGAAAGAAVGSVLPVIGTAIGAGLGGLLGALSGFLTRLAWSEDRWLKKLEPNVRENVFNILVHGMQNEQGQRVVPVVEAVTTYIHERTDTFYKTVQQEVENAVASVRKECDDLLSREQQIRRESDLIIQRLEPKVLRLQALRERANTALGSFFKRETVRA